MNCCPTCGRRFVADRSEEKKQVADKAKAWQAIEVLDRFVSNPTFMAHELTHPAMCSLVVARAAEERDRLLVALDNPEALRSIYRRNEKRKAVQVASEPVAA